MHKAQSIHARNGKNTQNRQETEQTSKAIIHKQNTHNMQGESTSV